LAKGLAGKAAANDVNACNGSLLLHPGCRREAETPGKFFLNTARQYGSFDHPRRGDAQRLESEVESADASERLP